MWMRQDWIFWRCLYFLIGPMKKAQLLHHLSINDYSYVTAQQCTRFQTLFLLDLNYHLFPDTSGKMNQTLKIFY
uniref:Uncharacterized protein n=1 Tax=Anguilla anguilla TaxID=7936 RepID=A0A0E9R3X7_ANGAN